LPARGSSGSTPGSSPTRNSSLRSAERSPREPAQKTRDSSHPFWKAEAPQERELCACGVDTHAKFCDFLSSAAIPLPLTHSELTMAEPKKETVRIVLPARRDGTPVTSSPRETAMINLPPKPVPVPGGNVPVPPPSGLRPPPPPSGLSAPAIPRPPSMPSIPKPPSSAGIGAPPPVAPPPSFPKPPSMPPAAAVPAEAPKPPSVMPAASVAPIAPRPPTGVGSPVKPVAPAPLQAEAKKETAKVPASAPGTKTGLPQATVQLQRGPEASKSASTSGAITVAAAAAASSGDLSPVLGIAALVVALLSLGMQLWLMVG